jgi:hypothetical protein
LKFFVIPILVTDIVIGIINSKARRTETLPSDFLLPTANVLDETIKI